MSITQLQAMELQYLPLQEREGFKVTDLSSANWCLRKLQALTARENEVNGLADAEVQRIENWREHEVSGIHKDIDFFTAMLTEYHREQLAADPKNNKTISTPYGKLKSVTRKPSVKKVDDEAILQYLKTNAESTYIVTKESVAWSELKKALQPVVQPNGTTRVVDWNGEEVPGVDVDLGGTSFTVEVEE